MLKRVIGTLESFAPLNLSEAWDNTGLLIEAPFPRPNTTRVFLTIDLTNSVLMEAIEDPLVGVIISYHPPLFSKFKRLCMQDEKQKIALKCIASGISVYSPHTALDSCVGGINDWLSSGLGPGDTKPIKENELQFGSGSGRIHYLAKEESLSDITNRIKRSLGLDFVRQAKPSDNPTIKSIAICAGSGSSVLNGVKADLYLTGEMGHHDVLAAIAQGTSVILCEHSNTERGFLQQVLVNKLQESFEANGDNYEVICSKLDKDPLRIV